MVIPPSATFVEPMPTDPQIPYFTTATGLRLVLLLLLARLECFLCFPANVPAPPTPALVSPSA